MKQKSNTITYNLSKSYQVNENATTMRAIMPASIAHSIIFTVYIIAAMVVYYETNLFTNAAQKAATEGVYMINTFYIFTMVNLLGHNVSNGVNKLNVTIIKNNETDVYFKMFQSQIGAKDLNK
uniref:Uncharacterized protein n=1 Tax=Acrobeloides nanus TaxID=290746 RepID=A0A914D993_9BILA